MHEKDTDQLFEELKIQPDVEIFLAENQTEFTLQLYEYLNKLLQEKNLSKKDVVNSVNESVNNFV